MVEPVPDTSSAAVFDLLLAKRKIILEGHSHVVASTGHLQSENLQLLPVAGYEGICFHCGPGPRDRAYWLTLRWALPSATIVIFWYGNEHNAHFLLRPEPLLDFVPASAPESAIDDQALLVPESLVGARLNAAHAELAAYLEYLTSATKARVVLAGSPPPKGDEAELKRLLLQDWYYRNQASLLGLNLEEARITPGPLRLKLWRVTQDLMAEAADRYGCEFFAVPEAAIDERGFLRGELWAEDATHGNAKYGRLVLEALARRFGS